MNKIGSLFILTILTILISTQARAVDASDDVAAKNAVGLTLGWVVANGLSYRSYFDNSFVQGTFAGFIDKELGNEYVDLSISYSRYLNRSELKLGSTPIGLKVVGGIEAEHDKNKDPLDSITSTTHFIHTGVGLGLDIGHPGTRGIVVEFNIIYTASFKGFSSPEFNKLELRPSAGIHYNL